MIIQHTKRRLFSCCCYGFAINGMAVLVIGSILPDMMSEAGLSFAAAGGMLSLMAIGNFLASFLFPAAVSLFGRRLSITAITAVIPVSYLWLTFLPPVFVLYALMFVCGIARGSITIINNSTVNDLSDNPAKMQNYLHCSFAVGAFLAPFTTAVFLGLGFGWRVVIYILVFLCASSSYFYGTADYSCLPEAKKITREKESEVVVKPTSRPAFFRAFPFYCICLLLFFYVGFESCVNGWFVTYLQNTGIVTAGFSSTLVSITWAVIMAGRLACAALSDRIPKRRLIFMICMGSALFFFLLTASGNLMMITAALIGLGFCMAGIYPLCVAEAGAYMKGSALGMSILTAVSSLGGIVSPQLVGSIADHIGIVAAIGTLSVNAVLMVFLSCLICKKDR